jgi:HD-like signal output (HDOD) protein
MQRRPVRKSLGKKKTEEGYGRGEHSIDLDDDVLIDEGAIKERILAAFNSPDYRPPTLPSTALELVRLSSDSEVAFDDVVSLLEGDSMLAGRVLRIAQSPVYAGAAQVQSLRDALVRLGLKTLRDLVLEVATNLRVFRSPAYAGPMERIRRHCNATGHLSRLVSRYTPIEAEYAFLCGLLHDVGTAGILVALGDVPRGKTPPDLSVLWPAIDGVHEEAAALMAKLWNLPPEIPLVVSAHHRVLIEGYPHPMAATVCLAERLADDLGLGLVPQPSGEQEPEKLADLSGLEIHTTNDRSSDIALERAREALQINDQTMQLIEREARERVESLLSLESPPA